MFLKGYSLPNRFNLPVTSSFNPVVVKKASQGVVTAEAPCSFFKRRTAAVDAITDHKLFSGLTFRSQRILISSFGMEAAPQFCYACHGKTQGGDVMVWIVCWLSVGWVAMLGALVAAWRPVAAS